MEEQTITGVPRIAEALQINRQQVENTLRLLQEGATIPFISRYRKEATGGLDEVQIGAIHTQHERLQELCRRRETILGVLREQGKLTDELARRIAQTWDATTLEDIYLPYKVKRKTRAEAARGRGLAPLAELLLLQRENRLHERVRAFLGKEVPNEEEALKGARDIVAEQVSEDEIARNTVRRQFARAAQITARVVKAQAEAEKAQKFRDYFDFSEPLNRCTSHRLLALRRGEAEGVLKVSISPCDEECIERLNRQYVRGRGACSEQVELAVADGYKRLLKPSIETEFAAQSKQRADEEAIRVFVTNLRQLLLAPPLGQKRTLGIDPGFRTGCKVVCLDAQGQLLHFEAIYPHPPKSDVRGASAKVELLMRQYKIEAIAIGNGTASRETEQFVRSLHLDGSVQVYVVSEDGASIYSASALAREEFPDYDVTVRGAVSIGRRLMDPLAELVKIDPKSIGVGQYQHDVDQAQLKKSLDQTVESCVNSVGVNLNTASKHLLMYVSGLGPVLAQNIVDYRTANGPFKARQELLKVPRLGNKAYEQCAGFLRIPGARNPLDNSAVHPERYSLVEHMAADLGCSVADLMQRKELRQQIKPQRYVSDAVGLPTLHDILQELEKPGRDPRQQLKSFSFDPNVCSLNDLVEGMELDGIVTNITNFGVFVDIGVHEKGLVHISQLADRFVSDPSEVVSVQQVVRVRVLGIDTGRKRISLSMKGLHP